MGRNLPGYAELDQGKREREESQRSAYQKFYDDIEPTADESGAAKDSSAEGQ